MFQNDGDANCFIFNDVDLFWTYHSAPLSVHQLDGSHVAT
jgi:hypothetical protein